MSLFFTFFVYINSNLGKFTDEGIVACSKSKTTKVTLGYKPSFLFIITTNSSSNPITGNSFMGCYYDAKYSTTQVRVGSGVYTLPLSASQNNSIISIDDDGFTFGKVSSVETYSHIKYYAIK